MTRSLGNLVALGAEHAAADLSVFDEEFLLRCIATRTTALGLPSTEDYLSRLADWPTELAALVDALHVGYSEFFRNPIGFALLEQRVLPALLDNSRGLTQAELRLWSAGCATGEEPYSLAILLNDLSGTRQHPNPWRLFATDRSDANLAHASAGQYHVAALQNVRLKHLARYFSQVGEFYTVRPNIRSSVSFSNYDLLDPLTTCPPASIFGDFDLVLCCNLLLYYRPIRQRLLEKLTRSLAPGGYLITGESERALMPKDGELQAVTAATAVFQKR